MTAGTRAECATTVGASRQGGGAVMRIGFIGLGTMGRHMASHLMKAGHELVVYDVRREAAAPHLRAGASWADTPRDVAAATELVFTSLPGPPEAETVALGEQGVLAGLAAGPAYLGPPTHAAPGGP